MGKCREVASAIQNLKVRGAPLIGVTAGFGCVLGAFSSSAKKYRAFRQDVEEVISMLASTRPTAVNLFWALERMREVLTSNSQSEVDEIKQLLLREALTIMEEDERTCKTLGGNGADLLKDGMKVLTHCNAGSLATSYWGTALGVLYSAQEQGKRIEVWATETRPLLQGARLTCWELREAGFEPTLITDNSAGWVMKREKIDCVLVGADRIALNGDVANKIGTYSLSILAKEHGIPVFVAAPLSTVDPSIETGEEINIERSRLSNDLAALQSKDTAAAYRAPAPPPPVAEEGESSDRARTTRARHRDPRETGPSLRWLEERGHRL